MDFQIGDVVQLKSGGPPMTVTSVKEKVWCTWFNRTDSTFSTSEAGFPPATLKRGAN